VNGGLGVGRLFLIRFCFKTVAGICINDPGAIVAILSAFIVESVLSKNWCCFSKKLGGRGFLKF